MHITHSLTHWKCQLPISNGMKVISGLFVLVLVIVVIVMLRVGPSTEPAETALVADLERIETELAAVATEDSEPEVVVGAVESLSDATVVAAESEPVAVAVETVSSDPTPAVTAPADQARTLEEQLAALQAQFDDEVFYDTPQPYIEISNPSGYVNSEPFTLSDFVGEKVILMKFTTFSCINCQRTYPYVKDWHAKYEDEGLQVVFVHTPEFSFEHDITNVENAMREEGITFPVVLDNDYSTWRSYANRFWPRMYLIDINGNIVYDHIGEGAYSTTERAIQQLLAERDEKLGL